MALDDYTGLVDTVISYAFRSGDDEFAAAVPTFIQLAESRINRTLRVAEMETAATITLTDGSGDLPADFLEARRLDHGSSPYGSLELVTPDFASDRYGVNPSGIARQFTIIGTTLKTYPSGTGDLTLVYYAKVPALTALAPTNWLLTKAPELYLYGSLVEAAPFMMDDARVQGWMTLFLGALKDLRSSDAMGRFSSARARTSGPTP